MDLWSKMTEWLKENPWWGALGFLIGVIGIIITIIGRHTKEPIYAIQSTNLIQDFTGRFDSLEITYARKRISNLTATKVAFWNNGKDTINSGDIASADPLMIRVKNRYKILDSKVLCTKKDANQFKIIPSTDGSHVLIQFDYLDKGEGGVVQLLHTGKSPDDVEVCGTIKGVGSVSVLKPFFWKLWSVYILCGSIHILSHFIIAFIKIKGRFLLKVVLFFIILTPITIWVLGSYIIFSMTRVPTGFKIFYE